MRQLLEVKSDELLVGDIWIAYDKKKNEIRREIISLTDPIRYTYIRTITYRYHIKNGSQLVGTYHTNYSGDFFQISRKVEDEKTDYTLVSQPKTKKRKSKMPKV